MVARMGLSLWGAILTDGAEQPPARVIVDGGRIVAIESVSRPRQGDVVIEPGEGWIAPGLVDLQVNGAGGVDLTAAVATAEAEEDVGGPIVASPAAVALQNVARILAAAGVTAFCPTIVSSPLATIVRALVAYGPRVIHDGAESLGAHVEGPFIDADHRGVHDPAALRPASETEIHQWLAHGTPAIVTVAPEQPGAMAAIAQLNAAGTVVFFFHDTATTE